MFGIRDRLKRRTFLGALSTAGLLAAVRVRAQDGTKPLLIEFFKDAQLQIETKAQRAELARALDDMENAEVEALKDMRYADYRGQPAKWTALRMLKAYFHSPAPLPADDAAFYVELQNDNVRMRICQFTAKFTPMLKEK